jgi:hypothetical protein
MDERPTPPERTILKIGTMERETRRRTELAKCSLSQPYSKHPWAKGAHRQAGIERWSEVASNSLLLKPHREVVPSTCIIFPLLSTSSVQYIHKLLK